MKRLSMALLTISATALLSSSSLAADAKKLVDALGGEDAVARFQAEEQLVAMGDDAVEALQKIALAPGDTPRRRYAINILARIGSDKAIAVLLRVLDEEKDVVLRGLLCEHVGRLGVEDAVPIIGRWLATIRGKPLGRATHPVVLKPLYGWMRHVHALREIGSEKGIPILEAMIKAGQPGQGGKAIMRDYTSCLRELRKEADFRAAVRAVPGLEESMKTFFAFCRTSDLARMRHYRMKVIDGGEQGRRVLEDLSKHPDEQVSQAAKALLKSWDALHPEKGTGP